MAVDQAERQNFSSLFLPGGMVESVNPCLILMVRRENVVEDTMEVLRKSKNVDYKKPLKVMVASPCIFVFFPTDILHFKQKYLIYLIKTVS